MGCSGRTGLTGATGVVATDWSGATGPDPGVLGAATVPGHAAFAVAAAHGELAAACLGISGSARVAGAECIGWSGCPGAAGGAPGCLAGAGFTGEAAAGGLTWCGAAGAPGGVAGVGAVTCCDSAGFAAAAQLPHLVGSARTYTVEIPGVPARQNKKCTSNTLSAQASRSALVLVTLACICYEMNPFNTNKNNWKHWMLWPLPNCWNWPWSLLPPPPRFSLQTKNTNSWLPFFRSTEGARSSTLVEAAG